MPAKIFINNLDTYVSQAVWSEFRKDPKAEEEADEAAWVYGTYITKDSTEKPDPSCKKMLKRSKPRLAAQYIAKCDLIVYDLHSGNPKDVQLAIDALKKYVTEEEPGEDKVLVLISSLMAWDATPRKLEKLVQPGTEEPEDVPAEDKVEGEGEEGEDAEKGSEQEEEVPEASIEPPAKEYGEEGVEGEEGEGEGEPKSPEVAYESPEDTDEPLLQKKKIRRRHLNHAFTEEDYKTRQASNEFGIIKEVEDLVLAAQRAGIKTYVIAAGVLYGKGEAIFNSHFKKAWLQNPERLPIVGEGKNYVPTVHVTDLARMVKKIFQTKPERQYIFGIDNTKKPRQRRLIEAISSGIGTGLVESIDIPPYFEPCHPARTPLQLDLDWRKFLLLNIKAKPSTLFVTPESGEAAEDGDDPPEDTGDFKWFCKSGLAANIQEVKNEFCEERNLKPFKIAIVGKPFTGKSFYAKQLAEHYNVPHIHACSVLHDIQNFDKAKREEFEHRQSEKKRIVDLFARRAEELKVALEDAKNRQIARDQAKRRRRRRRDNPEEYADSEADGIRIEEPVEEDEDNIDREVVTSPKAAEDGEGDGDMPPNDGAEGEAADVDPIMAAYAAKLKQADADDLDTDDEYNPLEIRTKVQAFQAEHGEKLSSELMSEAFRWRLSQTDCQNRGYVLDGYPKSYKTAQEVFVVTPIKPEKAKKQVGEGEDEEEEEKIPEPEEEEEEENKKKYAPQFQKHIYPNSVVYLRGVDSEITHREELTGETSGERVDQLRQRLEKYAAENDLSLFTKANQDEKFLFESAPTAHYPMNRFFQENKTEVFEIDHDGDKFEMFESMRVYIERNGRPFNYLSSVRSLNRKREGALTKEEIKTKEEIASKKEKSAETEQKKKDHLCALADGRLDMIAAHMHELKAARERHNMRQFLMKAIIPVLTEGMIDVWRVNPVDPVDYLAEYVFKKSNETRK